MQAMTSSSEAGRSKDDNIGIMLTLGYELTLGTGMGPGQSGGGGGGVGLLTAPIQLATRSGRGVAEGLHASEGETSVFGDMCCIPLEMDSVELKLCFGRCYPVSHRRLLQPRSCTGCHITAEQPHAATDLAVADSRWEKVCRLQGRKRLVGGPIGAPFYRRIQCAADHLTHRSEKQLPHGISRPSPRAGPSLQRFKQSRVVYT